MCINNYNYLAYFIVKNKWCYNFTYPYNLNVLQDDSKNIVFPGSDLMSKQLIASEHKKSLEQNVVKKVRTICI